MKKNAFLPAALCLLLLFSAAKADIAPVLTMLSHSCEATAVSAPPSFDPYTRSYLVTVASWETGISFIPTVPGGCYTTVNGQYVASGTASAEILLSDGDYRYLQPQAKQALAEARAAAAGYDLDHLFTRQSGRLLMHPWLGTRKLDTLTWLLRGRWSNPLLIQTVKPAGGKNALLVETLLPRRLFSLRR